MKKGCNWLAGEEWWGQAAQHAGQEGRDRGEAGSSGEEEKAPVFSI